MVRSKREHLRLQAKPLPNILAAIALAVCLRINAEALTPTKNNVAPGPHHRLGLSHRRGTALRDTQSILDTIATTVDYVMTPETITSQSDLLSSSPPTTTEVVEASVLKELSRVTLDVITLVAPTTLILRLALVTGRVFGMEADYLSDHAIASDALLFDVPLLALYAYLFSRSVLPVLQSTFTSTSELDDLVFQQLFSPVGVSWIQYRSMLAANCIDWITIPPHTVLIDEDKFDYDYNQDENEDIDYLYWVYEGDYAVSHKGCVIYTIERDGGKCIDDPSAVGFNGDMRFLYNLDRKKRREDIKSNNNGPLEEPDYTEYPMSTTTIGGRGATLMRMNSEKLFDLMENDEQLAASIRALLLKSLQRKVGAFLVNRGTSPSLAADNKTSDDKISST